MRVAHIYMCRQNTHTLKIKINILKWGRTEVPRGERQETGGRPTAGLGENRWLLTQPLITQALLQVEPAVTYSSHWNLILEALSL